PSGVGNIERQAHDITVALTRRRDHGLAPVDGDDRAIRRNEPRQRRGVVAEPTADLQDPAPGAGADKVITLALALGEKRERVDQGQTAREHREIRRGVDALKSPSEVVDHVFLLPSRSCVDNQPDTLRPYLPDLGTASISLSENADPV